MKSKFIFIHMPKCAGTYIATSLSNNFADNKQACIYGDYQPFQNIDNIEVIYENRQPISWNVENILDYDFIYGHTTLDIIKVPGIKEKFNVIVNFREPFELFKSYYFHTIRELLHNFTHPHKSASSIEKCREMIYGPRFYLNSVKGNSFYRHYDGLNFEYIYTNINDIDFLVENKDVVEFVNFIQTKFNLVKVNDRLININNNHIKSEMEHLFNDLEDEFKSRFKEDYKMYDFFKHRKWTTN